ncbi:hypothetical protein R54767_01776 [Paraburkholderia gardini]|uniref:DUF2946 family protein n=2 Tax=Paraburkholderia gardini TaxID=2823469 RepID=A0ABN7QHZ3_9BURK|nr:hypothetical protein R54767_01776 [Paraburkholderia gardini]
MLDCCASFTLTIMTLRPRNRMTAWLGLIAMWLIVFAPVVSQMVASNRLNEPTAALCSALHPQGATQLAQASPAPVHLSHADAFGACGYCHLLEHHVALPGVASFAPVASFEIARAAPSTLSTRFTPLGAFPSGRPRDPPAIS